MPTETKPPDSALKSVVMEACSALAHLDSGRLEEVAKRCESLSASSQPFKRNDPIMQTPELVREMAIFSRVLEATRANVEVMQRLRVIHATLEYSENGGQNFLTGNCDGLH